MKCYFEDFRRSICHCERLWIVYADNLITATKPLGTGTNRHKLKRNPSDGGTSTGTGTHTRPFLNQCIDLTG